MGTVGQLYHNVILSPGTEAVSTAGEIFGQASNVVTNAGANYFTKLGVQAPPGTRFVLNGTKDIIVGKTGLYELDGENIKITSMYFIRPVRYMKTINDVAVLEKAQALKDLENLRNEQIIQNNIFSSLASEKINEIRADLDKYFIIEQKFLYGDSSANEEFAKDGFIKLQNDYLIAVEGTVSSHWMGDIDNIIIDYVYE